MFPRLALLRPMRGAFLSLAASALLLAACSGGGNTTSTASAGAASCVKPDANGVVKMSAENIAFNTSCIEVPAGTAFKIEFDNKDTAPHDVAVWDSSSKGKNLFTGDVVQPGAKTTYDVPALDAGEHYFECTIHPNMNGKVVAQ